MDNNEREFLKKLLNTHIGNWKFLKEKKEQFGDQNFPMHFQNQLIYEVEEIKEISGKLKISLPPEILEDEAKKEAQKKTQEPENEFRQLFK